MAKLADFGDLTAQTYQMELVSPSGEKLTVEMQALTPGDVLEIGKLCPPPKAPEKGIERDEQGGFHVIYDFEDPGYKLRVAEWSTRRNGYLIRRSLKMHIPGETEDEQIAALREQVSHWAWMALQRAAETLIAGKEQELLLQPFHAG